MFSGSVVISTKDAQPEGVRQRGCRGRGVRVPGLSLCCALFSQCTMPRLGTGACTKSGRRLDLRVSSHEKPPAEGGSGSRHLPTATCTSVVHCCRESDPDTLLEADAAAVHCIPISCFIRCSRENAKIWGNSLPGLGLGF